ncbi:hypothetical protein GRJ2_000920000 [Grus japonensis]|uniref:Uncharacterized protein n=1 Tax=Grus japonensis TaxID=30415 RepID=A0ABC9WHM7_GRUJA
MESIFKSTKATETSTAQLIYPSRKSQDQLECGGPRILCIPNSKTPGVSLKFPLVLSARDSRWQLGEGLEVVAARKRRDKAEAREDSPRFWKNFKI